MARCIVEALVCGEGCAVDDSRVHAERAAAMFIGGLILPAALGALLLHQGLVPGWPAVHGSWLALALGMAFGVMVLRQTLEEMRAQDVALATARGALADVIAAQFTAWGLTPAERDVGFLALKGLDVAEIAELRGRAAGTVRAQLTRIYSKAGVSGRAQFAAYFVEDLLGEGLEGL